MDNKFNNTEQVTIKLFTKNFILIIIINIMICTYGQVLFSILPLYITDLGYNEAKTGLVVSIFSFSSILFRPFARVVLDSFPRTKVVFLSLLGFSILSTLLIKLNNIYFLFMIRVIQGILMCLIGSTLGTILAEILPTNRFDEGIGYYGIGIPAMSFLGPAMGTYFLKNYNYTTIFNFLSIVMLLCSMLILQLKYRHVKEAKSIHLDKRISFLKRNFEYKALFPSIILMLIVISHSSFVSYLLKYSEIRGIDNIGLFYVIAGISIISIRCLLTVINNKLDKNLLYFISMLTIIFSTIAVRYFYNSWVLIITSFFYGASIGIVIPDLIALALSRCDKNRYSAATTTYYTGFDLGFGIGILSWGIVANNIGIAAIYRFAFFVNLIALLLSFKHIYKNKFLR